MGVLAGAAGRVDDRVDVVALPQRVESGKRHANLGPEGAEDGLAPAGQSTRTASRNSASFQALVDVRSIGGSSAEQLRELAARSVPRVRVVTLIVEWTIGKSGTPSPFLTVETMFSSSRSGSIDLTAPNCEGWSFILLGVGMGFCFVPISIAALAGATSREAGLQSGLINTMQQIGGAVGLAILTTVADHPHEPPAGEPASHTPTPRRAATAWPSGSAPASSLDRARRHPAPAEARRPPRANAAERQPVTVGEPA